MLFFCISNEMKRDDDNTLMSQLKKGKVKALEGLVNKYKKQAYSIAWGYVYNADDAYDISQEAFVRVYQSAATFDESRKFFPWFYSIVANLSKNFLRQRRTGDAAAIDLDKVAHLIPDTDTPESSLLASEQKERLFSALRKMSFKHKEIINLYHFRMMSYDEIAVLLNIPKGTVMSRLSNARRNLAKLMLEEE